MAKLLLVLAVLFVAWRMLRPRRRIARAEPPVAVQDRAEARAILGVEPHADADAIRAAHRRLIAANHPDRGGSAELARRINAARDLLLRS